MTKRGIELERANERASEGGSKVVVMYIEALWER